MFDGFWTHEILFREADKTIKPQPPTFAVEWTPKTPNKYVDDLPADVEIPEADRMTVIVGGLQVGVAERFKFGWFAPTKSIVRSGDWIIMQNRGNVLAHLPQDTLKRRLDAQEVSLNFAGPMSFHDAMGKLETAFAKAGLHTYHGKGTVRWDPTSNKWRCYNWTLVHGHTRNQFEPIVARGKREKTGVRSPLAASDHPLHNVFKDAFGDDLGHAEFMVIHRQCPGCQNLLVGKMQADGTYAEKAGTHCHGCEK